MKRFYSLLLLVLAFCFQVDAQVCTPDPGATAPGPTPNPQAGLPSGTRTIAYNQTITFVVPLDTTVTIPLVGTVTATVNSWGVTGFTGLPAGITETCNVTPCTWTGGTTGCIKLSGIPTVAGNFTVQMATSMNVTAAGQTLDLPFPMPYNMDVIEPNSIGDELNPNAFGVSQNVPNPANGNTTIKFSSPVPSKVIFSMMNQFGQVVMQKEIVAAAGINAVDVETTSLANGIYYFNLNNGEETTSTLKMVVME